MPKTQSDYPINCTFRISVAQRDYLEHIAEAQEVKPSDVLRALLDQALTAEAKAALGVAGESDETALTVAHDVVGAESKEAAHA